MWPLGRTDIGTGMTEPQALAYLNTMAADGAPARAPPDVADQPHATWVDNPDDAISALDQLYADAAAWHQQSSGTRVGGGITTSR